MMDDNTFECPNCGSRVYPEQSRCPQCGQNMYPEDEEPASTKSEGVATGWVSTLGGLVIGWLIASAIALLIHFVVASVISSSMLGRSGGVILFGVSIIGALVGGFVCAALVKRNSVLLGGLVGLLSIPIAALLTTRWVIVTMALLLSPWFLMASLLIILAGIAGGWLSLVFSQNTAWKESWRIRGWEDVLYQDLLRKVRFNGSTADRLIDYERQQDPQATRLKQIQNAIERWEKDNR